MTTKTRTQTKPKKVTTLKFRVRIVVEKDEPGYHAFAPSLKGLHMGGDTPEEALNYGKEAAELYLKVMVEDGDPIPIDLPEPVAAKESDGDSDIVLSQVEEISTPLAWEPGTCSVGSA